MDSDEAYIFRVTEFLLSRGAAAEAAAILGVDDQRAALEAFVADTAAEMAEIEASVASGQQPARDVRRAAAKALGAEQIIGWHRGRPITQAKLSRIREVAAEVSTWEWGVSP